MIGLHGRELVEPTRVQWTQLRTEVIGRQQPGVLMIEGTATDGTAKKPLNHYGKEPWYLQLGKTYIVEYHGPYNGAKSTHRDDWKLLALISISYTGYGFEVGRWVEGYTESANLTGDDVPGNSE